MIRELVPKVPTGERVAKGSAPDEASFHTGTHWCPPCVEPWTRPGSPSAGSGGDGHTFKAMGFGVEAGGSPARMVVFQGRNRTD